MAELWRAYAQMSSRILLVPLIGDIWGFPKIRGTLLGVPIIRTYSILGSTLGSPYFGKLPYGPK